MNNKNLIIIIFIITAIYYIPIIKSPLAPLDEAVIIVGAERVLQGQIPYKDFLTLYGPAQVFTLAALFKVFGVSVTVERVYDIVIKTFLSLIIFLIIRRVSSHKTAIFGWAMSLIWIEYSYFHAYPVYPAVLFTFMSIYFLLIYMCQEKPLYIVLSAISIVCAILFRHDLGGLAAAAIAIALFLRKNISSQKSWIPLIYYIATGVLALLPIILYFIIFSDINAILNDLIYFPLQVHGQQELPYPAVSKWNLPFYVFPLVPLFGFITFFLLIKRKLDNSIAYGILFISLVGIVFSYPVLSRSDTIHLLPSALAGILLSPILFNTLLKMLPQNTRLHELFFILFIIFFGITLSKPIKMKIQLLPDNYNITVINPDIKRAKYPFISQDIKNVVSFIKKNTTANEYIYVGVINHDKFMYSDPIIYFLAERNCATKYHELNPGHTTTLKIQEEMVGELKDNHVRLAVLSVRDRYEPNLSSIDTKVDLLDNYISSHYELKEIYGLYEIWMKIN